MIDAIAVDVRLLSSAAVGAAYRRAAGRERWPPVRSARLRTRRARRARLVGRRRRRSTRSGATGAGSSTGGAAMWWTHGDRLVHAVAPDGDLAALFSWWRDARGRLTGRAQRPSLTGTGQRFGTFDRPSRTNRSVRWRSFTGLAWPEPSALSHVIVAMMWMGLLWFFNFVQTPAFAEMEASSRNDALDKLTWRALWWFRWSAAATVALRSADHRHRAEGHATARTSGFTPPQARRSRSASSSAS